MVEGRLDVATKMALVGERGRRVWGGSDASQTEKEDEWVWVQDVQEVNPEVAVYKATHTQAACHDREFSPPSCQDTCSTSLSLAPDITGFDCLWHIFDFPPGAHPKPRQRTPTVEILLLSPLNIHRPSVIIPFYLLPQPY